MDNLNSKIQKALNEAITIASRNMVKFLLESPVDITDDRGFYAYECSYSDKNWGRGFWAGIYWLLYEVVKKEPLKIYAQKKTEELISALKTDKVRHTDLGFLSFPSLIASYKLTGNEDAKNGVIYAVDTFLSNYLDDTKIIVDKGSIKISNIINILLLKWIDRTTDTTKYDDIADENIDLIIKYNILDDGMVRFRSIFDLQIWETYGGSRINYNPFARGQAWAILGLALTYAWTKNEYIFEKCKMVTDYFIMQLLDENYICYWDELHDGEKIPDPFAMSIAVCGILEMKMHSSAECIEHYVKYAENMLEALIDNFSVRAESLSEGLLKDCTLMHPNDCKNKSTLQSDYFYLEALVRFCGKWDPYWC